MWLSQVDTHFLGNPPDDGMPAAGPTLIGILDFSNVTGFRGSLNLSDVQVLAVDAAGVTTGEIYDVNPFTLTSVPVPAAVWMGLIMFGCIAGGAAARRRR